MAASRAARRPVYGHGAGEQPPVPTVMVPADVPVLSMLSVLVTDDVPLALGVDESYSLSVPSDGSAAKLTAKTQWGALRGLETFSQLVKWAPAFATGAPADTYTIANASVSIADTPRFQWRGLLLDTSRHYLHVDTIMRTLDAMAWNKFNTLHWHVVDDNSWPIESVKYPEFSKQGAYLPQYVYTRADVQAIVSYADDRGIRVVPEFDMPAHASVWGKAYPDLVITCDEPGGQTLLNPTGPVYDVFDGLLTEYEGVFTHDFIHIGGDEVHSMACWGNSSLVQQFAREHGLTNNSEVRQYFEGRVQGIVNAHGKRAIVWEEVFDGDYNVTAGADGTVVNVWLSAAETAKVVQSGRQAIHSYGFYLDQQIPPGPTHYFWLDTWMSMYIQEPAAPSLTPAEEKLILGGEASMWAEQIWDAAAEIRIWPRASATAERLWSSKTLRDPNAAFPRLTDQLCRQMQRGVATSPLRPADETGVCPLPM